MTQPVLLRTTPFRFPTYFVILGFINYKTHERGEELELTFPRLIYESDLKGSYQKHNIKTVIQSIKVLQNLGYNISNSDLKA